MRPSSQSIQHVFVLMLENRSFDHMLGFSGITGTDAETGRPTKINGLMGSEFNTYQGIRYPVTRPADNTMPVCPGHDFPDVLEQLAGPGVSYPKGGAYPPIVNTGFVHSYAAAMKKTSHAEGDLSPGELMKCYEPSQLPVLTTLAREFAVCDRWFSSLPGPTWPNRFFVNAASSGGLDHSPSHAEILDWEANPLGGFVFQNGSLFTQESLQWRIYAGGLFCIAHAMSGVHVKDIRPYGHFANDLQGPYTAQYTFIEPNYGDLADDSYRGGNSQHPLDDVRHGEALIKATYEAIRNSPLWNNSLLIITWDEHGGFYDSALPPGAPAPGDTQRMPGVNQSGFTFQQYGVRVPAVIVSPRIAQNVIDHRLYDHASVPATVEALFGLSPMTQRDASANNVLPLATLSTPRTDCPTRLPSPMAPAPQPAPLRQPKLPAPADPLGEGNLPGFLHIAMRSDLELSPPSAQSAIFARVKAIQTRAEAEKYMREVSQKLLAFHEEALPSWGLPADA
ncbi:alkaline phosphatase family protein [Stigmatella aurantiaca]|uniref:Phosphoesterase n=1 Tax=Stigmatella aurantiaca (strain DW4/3-1) TaxID=378806 RepID=Q08PF1_STIAD|nr:alkaline phosphatase family protein [Stigmatella aurantiaca]ADO71285.1 Phosphoesterase [Stigmatella aurantiaca DW4/3-1]EAU62358.1 phosphoesterase [Stigmatella aurantiaca DW4/3-1]